MVALAEKYAVEAQSALHEPVVFDEHALEPHDFLERQGVLSGLQHCPSPPLQPVPGRSLAFDLKTGAAVSQKEKAPGTRHQMRARPANRVPGLTREIERDKLLEPFGPLNYRTELPRAQQIVPHAVAAREPR